METVRQEGYKFCQDFSVPCYLTDRRAVLKPAGFMDLAQEIAYWAAQRLGFGYESLHIHHTAWVLVRMHVHFIHPVNWRDPVSLYTWHKGAHGLFYLRDFDLRDAQGRSAVTATSSWVVMDERTRRLVRPEDLQSLLDPHLQVDDAVAEPAPKLAPPKAWEAAGEHRVAWSELDINGHANNVRYVVWAMDCLPEETWERPVRDLYINFNKETTSGETVSLLRTQEGDSWYVEGRVDGKSCFLVKLDY